MKYRTIVADPPWPYDTSLNNAAAIPHSIKKNGCIARGVDDMGYPVMTMPELKALPVDGLADQDAHLYLWVTNAFMVEGHELAKAWGFKPKTIITWGKVHQNDRDRASMKTGYYFRGATEHALFCVRGSLPIQGTWPTLFLWPRIGAHSVKPEAFIDMVEAASPGPYLELFSRRHRLGWDVWGNESANTVVMNVPLLAHHEGRETAQGAEEAESYKTAAVRKRRGL